jgi:serine/threonine protein kinase
MRDSPQNLPDEVLTPLAEAISDGSTIDWESETAARPALAPLMSELKVLESLASVHRGPAPLDRAPGVSSPVPPIGRWGPLLLIERIGQGGFGQVYRAFDPWLQIEAALKLMRPERSNQAAGERFLKEGRRLARVRHPNVVVVHGVDRHDGTIGIWTDLVRGQTLEALLVEQGPFGSKETCFAGIDLARALAAVHGAGLVHGDVKTSNAMKEPGGRVVLMDFGSATEAAFPSGHGLWTPLTTAPEILRGAPETPASDLYSLGVLLYRLTTGHYPIEAGNIGDLVNAHMSGATVPLRARREELPADFVRVIETALEPEPRARFTSAEAMEQALAAQMPAPGGDTPPRA